MLENYKRRFPEVKKECAGCEFWKECQGKETHCDLKENRPCTGSAGTNKNLPSCYTIDRVGGNNRAKYKDEWKTFTDPDIAKAYAKGGDKAVKKAKEKQKKKDKFNKSNDHTTGMTDIEKAKHLAGI